MNTGPLYPSTTYVNFCHISQHYVQEGYKHELETLNIKQ
jgi:hypothetical protein